jgi:4a-hydroxytetrahydrobiopterin dehydratase
MTDFTLLRCRPCRKETLPLPRPQAEAWLASVPGWRLSADGRGLERDFLMKDFSSAVDFIRRMAEVAEAEDHHPDLHLTGYRRLAVVLSTHAIGGLSENDFILAAKIEALPKALKAP